MTFEAHRRTTETKRGNEARLASLYDEYYDRIARYAYACIRDKKEAEDIAGEVFLKALESLGTYQERGVPMQAWLFKIARNLVVDRIRKLDRLKAVPIDTVEVMDETDLETNTEMTIELERVAVAIQGLTEEQREVLRLRFFGELTPREVGSLLNKSDNAVRQMQWAALEKLRQLLSENTPQR
jgi:RNA polymerase sigma-70 factor (ECF subfamily)